MECSPLVRTPHIKLGEWAPWEKWPVLNSGSAQMARAILELAAIFADTEVGPNLILTIRWSTGRSGIKSRSVFIRPPDYQNARKQADQQLDWILFHPCLFSEAGPREDHERVVAMIKALEAGL
jgi:hypothetical protein